MIVDLHTHTTFSDGVLIPSESARRAKAAGYSGIAFTDHVDFSNYEHIISSQLQLKGKYNPMDEDFAVIVGGEITHVRPALIAELTKLMRKIDADIVVVHGETILEPVEEGTNRAAIEAKVDILAHPGLITPEDAKLAAKNGVFLEITTRRGHSYTNGHVAKMAKEYGANLVINNDFHSPADYVGRARALQVLKGAGLTSDEAEKVIQNSVTLFENKLKRKLK